MHDDTYHPCIFLGYMYSVHAHGRAIKESCGTVISLDMHHCILWRHAKVFRLYCSTPLLLGALGPFSLWALVHLSLFATLALASVDASRGGSSEFVQILEAVAVMAGIVTRLVSQEQRC
jgi:hypothetical protein